MNTDSLIDSVALFFEPPRKPVVSQAFVDKVVALSEAFSARPLLFTASGDGFELDDCYLYSDETEGLGLWNTFIPNRKRQLRDALRRDAINGIAFDVPLATATRRSEWSFNFSVQPGLGEAYWGGTSVEGGTLSRLAASASQAFEIMNRHFDVRYGFAYSMPLRDEPDCYATGSGRTSLAEIRQWLATRSTPESAPPTADECWQRELMGLKRHLEGLFRDAYPVNLISSAHVERADLTSAGIGLLTKLDQSRWLWQIEAEQLDLAREQLAKTQSLVRQYSS